MSEDFDLAKFDEYKEDNRLKMFNLIGYGERTGSGVPDIYAVWRQAGYVEPTVEEQFGAGQPNRTVVTLPLIEMDHHPDLHPGEEKGEDTRKELILNLIRENPRISMAKMSEATGLTKRQVEKTLRNLKSEQIIRRDGPDRGGSWIING